MSSFGEVIVGDIVVIVTVVVVFVVVFERLVAKSPTTVSRCVFLTYLIPSRQVFYSLHLVD